MRRISRRRRTGSSLSNSRGVTLFELVILLVIAAIALPGLMIYFTESMHDSADAQMNTMGLGLAQELMEEIKAKQWDQTPGAMSAIGKDGVESRCDPIVVGCSPYNDIDDYDGMDKSPPEDPHGTPLPSPYTGFEEQVSVCYVAQPPAVGDGGNNADGGACVAGGATTDYKKITVTVTWGDTVRVQLDTVMANYNLNQS